jgi:uncharacterized membrane protein YbaN (DUF454 family)
MQKTTPTLGRLTRTCIRSWSGCSLKRALLIIAGTIALFLGILGIIVPILPTTPFLLLAAACYMRSSERFYRLLIQNRVIGSYIKNYIEGKGMPLRVKLLTLVLLWTGILCAIIFATDNLILRIALLFIAAGVTIHIVLIRNRKKQVTE